MKDFEVIIEQVYCETIKVKAKTQAEAKKKAWDKWKPKKKLHRFWIDLKQF